MATVRNSDAIQNLRTAAAIQVGSEPIPNILSNTVVPILDISPKTNRTIIAKSLAANGTFFTTLAKGVDVYIVAASISFDKAVGDTGSIAQIVGTSNGNATSLLRASVITLTAERGDNSITIPHAGLKLDKGTSCTLAVTGTFSNVTGTIYYYEVSTVDS